MLNQAVAVTARLLTFRSGPEDFPFSPTPMLTRVCMALTVVAVTLPFSRILAPPAALALGAVYVGSVYVFLKLLLRLRKLENRFQQSFNALLTTTAVLTLLALPAWFDILPAMHLLYSKMLADPTLAESPERLSALQQQSQAMVSGFSALAVNVIGLWQFAVSAYVLARAADTRALGGIGLAVLAQLNLFAFMIFASPLLQLLGR